MNKHHNTYLYSLLALLILSFTLINIYSESNSKTVFIDGDGSGHYSWLPSIFVYNTIDFKEVFENERTRKGLDYQGHNYHSVNSTTINKFPPGTALMILPFFILALIISYLSGLPPDAYNIVFQYSAVMAAIFWVWVGLIFTYKLLLTYKIQTTVAFGAAIISFFGTNLMAYTFLMPAYSHAYSFTIISFLLYFTRIYFLQKKLKSLLLASLSLGIVFLIRPVNILVVLFLPFLASNSNTFISTIKEKIKGFKLGWAILIFLLVISPYFIINYIQTGQVIYFSYRDEGFYWDNPEIINFLFSFRKGWLVYTPLFLLLLPSVYFLYRKNKYCFFWFIFFFTVLTYVFSSWWNWFYGDGFGMRPMVDFTSIFILLIALSFNSLKGYLRSITLIFLFLVIGLNFLQTYQYAKEIIHPDSMNREAYFHVLLKTNESYSRSITDGPQLNYGILEDNPFYAEFNDFEKDYPNWSKLWNADTNEVFSGEYSLSLNEEKVYSPSLNWEIPDSLVDKRNIYVKIENMVFETSANATKNAFFIMDIQDKEGKTVFYKGVNLKQIPDNKTDKWIKMSTGFNIPHLIDNYYLVKIYVWNNGNSSFVIDDIGIEFYEFW